MTKYEALEDNRDSVMTLDHMIDGLDRVIYDSVEGYYMLPADTIEVLKRKRKTLLGYRHDLEVTQRSLRAALCKAS